MDQTRPLRASERLKHLESEDARLAWLGVVRDVVYYLTHLAFLLAAGAFCAFLGSDDPSGIDDSMLYLVLLVLVLLGVPILVLALVGAERAPAWSALLFLGLVAVWPLPDLHLALVPASVWLVVQACLLAWCILRRIKGRDGVLRRGRG